MFIISDQLTKTGFDQTIKDLVYSFETPVHWEYSDVTCPVTETPIGIRNQKVIETFYFAGDISVDHPIYVSMVEYLRTIMARQGLKLKNIVRFRSNIFTKQDGSYRDTHHTVHVDSPVEGRLSFLYYVEDADGPTVFFNETYSDTMSASDLSEKTRIFPKQGRYVVFDSNRYHASSSPVDSSKRSVLNIVFEVE